MQNLGKIHDWSQVNSDYCAKRSAQNYIASSLQEKETVEAAGACSPCA
jgi:hypothetical protein